MNSPKLCLVCGTKFIPKTYRHHFCCRKCFLEWFKKSQKQSKYPTYNCPVCRKQIQLDFFPKMNGYKWEHLKCPHCGHENDNRQAEREEEEKIRKIIKLTINEE